MYWQIMWRFVSPALMAAIIASSMYFMLTNTPTYSAWNKEKVGLMTPYIDTIVIIYIQAHLKGN